MISGDPEAPRKEGRRVRRHEPRKLLRPSTEIAADRAAARPLHRSDLTSVPLWLDRREQNRPFALSPTPSVSPVRPRLGKAFGHQDLSGIASVGQHDVHQVAAV